MLGRDTSIKLGVLRIGLPSMEIKSVTNSKGDEIEKFPHIKDLKVRIDIDTTVTPVAQLARRVPLALKEKVTDEIEKMLKMGIIERVPDTENPSWVSPLVVVPKGKDDIRMCCDYRRLNLAIKRKYHLMPVLDEFFYSLHGAKYFSILDIKKAYWQCLLAKESRSMTAFSTHVGTYQFTRVPFGVSCAPEIFQQVLEQMLAGIKNAKNLQDDIIVWGETAEIHDQSLKLVLKMLKDRNVLLNHEKCKFKVTECIFLGHHISHNGVKPTDSRISAIKQFRKPETCEELRSFLGMISYVGRFIENLATKTHVLREMCRSGTIQWEEVHNQAYRQLIEDVAKAPVLAFFSNKRQTKVVADASSVGLGAVLVQFEDNDVKRPIIICYASKALTDTEKLYSQVEKEALAIVWAVKRFEIYLLGRDFEVETDHRPLERIFRPTSAPPGRIERWVMKLQEFRFKVVYRPGKSNIADPFSRLAVDKEMNEFDQVDEGCWIHAIIESVAVDMQQIKEESEADEEIQNLKQAVISGKWFDEETKRMLKDYLPFMNEITEVDGYMIRLNRLIIPKVLRKRILQLAHEGHPGKENLN